MNKATQRIKAKGYTLAEFLVITRISLSSYRRYEKKENKFNSFLQQLIDDLEVRHER